MGKRIFDKKVLGGSSGDYQDGRYLDRTLELGE
jgi:hypothetical protein